MSDPVAEAAAQIAAQQAEPSMLAKAMDTIHDLEATVEHLIHPESVPNVTPESPAIDASATLSDAPASSTETSNSVKPSESLPTEALAPATPSVSSEPSTIIQTSSAGSDLPKALGSASITEAMTEPSAVNGAASPKTDSSNGVLSESTPSANTSTSSLPSLPPIGVGLEGSEVPNAVSGAAESTTVTDSASPASGSGETSSIGANSARPPLHELVAEHLESIYRLVRNTPTAPSTDTIGLKTHVGDILHRISNGMAVTEGELVQKLESLYRML